MWKKLFLLTLLGLAVAGLSSSPAAAQATRTWVSGVGDDVNPCSRTAPCKTFAGAISKTAAQGEIDCLDPGGFGGLTITKSITIDCSGTFGSVLVSGTNAINVSAGATDVVILRGLSLNGLNNSNNGIQFNSGAQLSVERCMIFGFTQNAILVASSGASEVFVTNTYITKSSNGIGVNPTAHVEVTVDHTQIANITNSAVYTLTSQGIEIFVTNSVVNGASTGFAAGGGGTAIGVDSSSASGTNTAFIAQGTGAIIRISNNIVYSNGANFTVSNGAQIASSGNNRVTPAGPAPGGTVTLQ